MTDDKDDAGKYQESNSYDVCIYEDEDDKINNRSLSHAIFCRELRFVAIYALFGDL